jgi:cell division protein FtsZ
MILGGEETPVIPDDLPPMPVMTPAQQLAARAVSRVEPPRAPPQQPEERRLFGLFGRKKKDEPRMEALQRTVARPAAPSMQRQQPVAEPPRAPQPAQSIADDLFPEQKDEQFEIPAFLRRQSN